MIDFDEKVLDKGYLKLVDCWGSEEAIVEAARMSTGKGFLGWGGMHYFKNENAVCVRCGISSDGMVAEYSVSGQTPCKPEGDEKLLRYLWENRHHTPFEMAGITIEVKAPIFVFREWHRHRVPFCLAGDTEITCIGSGGKAKHYTIEHIFKMKHEGVVDHLPERVRLPRGRTRNGYSGAGKEVLRDRRLREVLKSKRVRALPGCQHRNLRVLDEQTELYETGQMAEVWKTGIKEVWAVSTVVGHVLKASADHRFYTREGWKRAEDLRPGDRLAANGLVASMERPIPPSLRSGIGVWTSMMRSRLVANEDRCYVCGGVFAYDDLQLDHVTPVVVDLRQALDERNLRPICRPCHRQKTNGEQALRQTKTRLGLRWVELKERPTCVGEEETYDIEVEGQHHNFVANGLVVHNSYNEMSARYAPLPDEDYVPTVERLMLNSKTNKQAGTVSGSLPLTWNEAEAFRIALGEHYERSQTLYERALKYGVPKELARIHLPVGRYSRMRASANLRGWLAFLTLRAAPAAQWEIRAYAEALRRLVGQLFSRTAAFWDESR